MEIVMIKNTVWQNLVVKIGMEFTVPDSIGSDLIKRGCAKDRTALKVPTAEEIAAKHVKATEKEPKVTVKPSVASPALKKQSEKTA